MLTDRSNMTIAVNWDDKPQTKQTNETTQNKSYAPDLGPIWSPK